MPIPASIVCNMELFKFQDTVTYRIVAQDANNYFYIAPESGGIYLRRSIVLSNSINNRYVVQVWILSYLYQKGIKDNLSVEKGFHIDTILIIAFADDCPGIRQPFTTKVDQCHSYY